MYASSWKKALGFAAFAFVLSGGKVLATCTGGSGWTPEDFSEYLTLNDTTGWEGLAKLQHCTTDDLVADASGALEKRAGGNQWNGYSGSGCSGQQLATVSNFGCGVCVTATTSFFYSGWLYRERPGNPYPTADYFTGAGCRGTVLNHQGIPGSDLTSCNSVTRAASVILYQGC